MSAKGPLANPEAPTTFLFSVYFPAVYVYVELYSISADTAVSPVIEIPLNIAILLFSYILLTFHGVKCLTFWPFCHILPIWAKKGQKGMFLGLKNAKMIKWAKK